MSEAHNPQYSSPGPLFAGGAVYDNTGAPGSLGDVASETAGPVVGSPVVSAPYGSSQLPANMPRLDVLSGDTSGMSSDRPVGDNFAKISGADPGGMMSAGPWQGQVWPPDSAHPAASGRGE